MHSLLLATTVSPGVAFLALLLHGVHPYVEALECPPLAEIAQGQARTVATLHDLDRIKRHTRREPPLTGCAYTVPRAPNHAVQHLPRLGGICILTTPDLELLECLTYDHQAIGLAHRAAPLMSPPLRPCPASGHRP